MKHLCLLAAFLAGACSLSLEVLWARCLTIEAGGPLASFTIVVSSYMLGLAIGAVWIGRAADRSAGPLALFGLLQGASGGFALIVAALTAQGGAARSLLAASSLQPGTPPFLLLEIALGGGLAMLPALAMGGTLPLLVRTVGAHGAEAGSAGSLASANAAGAAIGSLSCGFVLLPGLGLIRSLLVTGVVLIVLGLLALVVARRGRSRDTAFAAGGPAETSVRLNRDPSQLVLGAIVLALFASGLALTGLEIVWTRLACLSFGSSVQAGSLVLAAVITGVSLGNAAGTGLILRFGPRPSSLALLAIGGALSICLTDQWLGRLPSLALRMAAWLLPSGESSMEISATHASQFGLMFSLVLLPSLFLGAFFPVGCAAMVSARRGGPGSPSRVGTLVGLASAAISSGNLLGAPSAYLGLLGQAGSRGCLLASAGVMALAGFLVPSSAARAGSIRAAAAAALVLILGALAFGSWDPDLLSSGPFLYGALYGPTSGPSHESSLKQALRRRGDVIFSKEGPDALVTVRRGGGGTLSIQVNGKTDASSGGDMKTQMLTAHLPLLLHSRSPSAASRVLVVGLGSGVTVAAALAHPISSVEVIEISPEVIQAASFFEDTDRRVMSDPRTRLVLGDARSRLMFGPPLSERDLFDVIASQPSNPWIAGQGLLFTREFFTSARRHLAKGGMMCQWVQGYGLEPEDFRSVVATFADVFPHVSMWEESTAGGDYLLLGSQQALVVDPEALASRLGTPTIAEDLGRVEITGLADLLSHFVAGDEALRQFAAGARLQTEDRLSLEFTAPAALYRDTLGRIIKSLEPYRGDPTLLAGVDQALASELSRRARAGRKEREWAAGLGLLQASRAPDTDLMRAVSFLRAGMRAHALEILRSSSLRHPSERLTHLLLGYLYMSAQGSDSAGRAIRELQAAVEIDPDEPRGRLYLARALYAVGRLDAALAENLAASRLDPSLAEPFNDRCAMLLAADDVASAEASCLEALSRDPSLAEAHANLGVVQSRRGRPDAAERSFRRALELDGSLADARYNLAALCERRQRPGDGLAALAPLLSGPGLADAEVLRLAARLAIQAKDRDAARDYLEKSLLVEPENEESKQIKGMLR